MTRSGTSAWRSRGTARTRLFTTTSAISSEHRTGPLTCFEHAIALAPDAVDTLYNLGNICQDLGRLERAIGFFERALRVRPDAIELHNNLGTALQALGRLDEAIARYRKALALRPDAVET